MKKIDVGDHAISNIDMFGFPLLGRGVGGGLIAGQPLPFPGNSSGQIQMLHLQ